LKRRGHKSRAHPTGLKIRAELDRGAYPTGIKISDDDFASLALATDDFHAEWNYELLIQ
jgi:hypothetical protein